MKVSSELPPVPQIALQRVNRDREPAPFLRVDRAWLVAQFPDGTQSAPFGYDAVTRRALDAVAIAAWLRVDGEVAVYLRTAVRPPLLERAYHPGAVEQGSATGMWELPAGLIEPEEIDQAPERLLGVSSAAARETEEELGFRIPASSFQTLGGGMFPAPGMTAERQYFVHVDVSDAVAVPPSLDGSPLEEQAAIALVTLRQALLWCSDGTITDSKTELALRRLQQVLGEG